MKVPLRKDAMLLAGQWAREGIEQSPEWAKGLAPEFVSFLLGLEKRGQRKGRAIRNVEMPRRHAEAFVARWFAVVSAKILNDEIPSRPPSEGLIAFNEILTEISKAIRRDVGRPMKVDPLVAYDLYLTEKQARKRGDQGSETSVERVAKKLGVSARAVDAALASARPLAEEMQRAQSKGRKQPVALPKRGRR